MDIVNAKAKGEQALQEVANAKERANVCRALHITITYHELVYETVGVNGEKLTVYRGTVNNKNLYVPMSGFVGVLNII